MINNIWVSILWVLAASFLGFAISAVFSGWLKLSRRIFLVPYLALSSVFLFWFFLVNEINLVALLTKNWAWGFLAGTIVGAFLVFNVRSQPASRQSAGGDLVLDIAWLGVAYGVIDALLLNVMPVLAIWLGFSEAELGKSVLVNAGVGILALLASLLVTLTYHLGYPEFRNRSIGLVLVGNSLITLAYLLSNNPLGAILSHTIMHIAAAIQGPETTIQLPPHNKSTLDEVVG
jgi:hypothetical protein